MSALRAAREGQKSAARTISSLNRTTSCIRTHCCIRHVRSERRWKSTCAKTAPPSRKDASSGELVLLPGNGRRPGISRAIRTRARHGVLPASRGTEHGAEDCGRNRAYPACPVKAWSLHEGGQSGTGGIPGTLAGLPGDAGRSVTQQKRREVAGGPDAALPLRAFSPDDAGCAGCAQIKA
jgi:hypothetical protein